MPEGIAPYSAGARKLTFTSTWKPNFKVRSAPGFSLIKADFNLELQVKHIGSTVTRVEQVGFCPTLKAGGIPVCEMVGKIKTNSEGLASLNSFGGTIFAGLADFTRFLQSAPYLRPTDDPLVFGFFVNEFIFPYDQLWVRLLSMRSNKSLVAFPEIRIGDIKNITFIQTSKGAKAEF